MVKTGKSAKKNTGALAASPSHLMHRALQLALDIYTEEVGSDGLTQRQFAVLEAVAAKAGLTQTDLVRATGIDRSTLADLVARMESKGLVERQRSTLDARAMAVRLTEAGAAALDAARPMVQSADKRILALLPKGRRDVFLTVLGELAATADAAPDIAKAEARAAKKAAKEARKAEKAARKIAAPKPDKIKKPKADKAAEKAPKAPKPEKPVKPAD